LVDVSETHGDWVAGDRRRKRGLDGRLFYFLANFWKDFLKYVPDEKISENGP
jgi:hypothetical protein